MNKGRASSDPALRLAPRSLPQREPAGAPPREIVLDGRRYFLVPADAEAPARPEEPRPASAADLLTERELQIAALVAEGRVNKEIATELRISEWTVSTHLRRIFAKLGVDTRTAMVCKCLDALSAR